MITVVSGLPRSGTSMCMQMLEAGGLPILSDGVRIPDEDNPRGYYEYEKAKSLAEDSSWLSLAEGKAIKIVSELLQYLPDEFDYRILFMRRPIEEVLASQAAMLERRKEEPGPNNQIMARHFQLHLSKAVGWLSSQSFFKTMEVAYHDVLDNPADEAGRMAKFLGLALDIDAMANAAQPKFRHHGDRAT